MSCVQRLEQIKGVTAGHLAHDDPVRFCGAALPSASRGWSHPNLDKEIHPLDFPTGQDRRDLLEFLNSLTGEVPSAGIAAAEAH
jgi:hypothetical protein